MAESNEKHEWQQMAELTSGVSTTLHFKEGMHAFTTPSTPNILNLNTTYASVPLPAYVHPFPVLLVFPFSV